MRLHPFVFARTSRVTVVLASLACLARVPAAQQIPIDPEPVTTEPFAVLDEVGGSWVNLATFPVRPMLYDPTGNLWVVNHHDSTVERFVALTTSPDKVYGVPWSPVAIAWWNGDATHGAELLVVCRGTWAVLGLDPATGTPKRLLQLRPGPVLPGPLDARIGRMAEPGDILVDEANERAFVSCTGADSVVQIDLGANQIVRVFNQDADPDLQLKSPLFLSWDHNNVDVLCAPLHSGNNSMARGGQFTSSLVHDLDGAQFQLPDEDLFRIKPYVNSSNTGSVEVVLRDMGTVLFAHRIHPSTSDFWQLNTEALNKDPNKQTEPKVKGMFNDNRVSIVQNAGTTWGTLANPILSLDPGGIGGAITAANTIGQPVALAFSASGHAFIAGLLTDNILVLDQNGAYVMEFNLPDGAIPRALLPHPTSPTLMLVYFWGLNKVRAYNVNPSAGTATPRVTYNLRHDPTPANVAAGRRVFFDAAHSLEQNISCATCHVEGGNDFLMWNLSNGPLEEKGPMFTQTLVGLQRLAPFHWRGERQLIDFKPAFVGLLGATPDDNDGVPEPGEEPTLADFELFEDFVFSLSNPANPNQNRRRLVDLDIHHPDTDFETENPPASGHSSVPVGDAIVGQSAFQSPANVNVARHSCLDCHDFPTGTNNDFNVEGEGSPEARRITMKPTPFHEIWRKRQRQVKVTNLDHDPNDPDSSPFLWPAFLGAGFSHLGTLEDLFRFVALVTDGGATQQANDITDFVHQWDQGLGLAVHFAYLLDASSPAASTTAELDSYLQPEMQKGNCDIAVIGTAKNALGALVRRRWCWDRVAAAYVCEDPAFASRSLAAFKTGATNDGEANVFVGLPRGMAERFAIDYDMDGVPNLDSTEIGSEYNPAQPGFDNGFQPAFASGGTPLIVWESTKVARLVFTTNEPTRATIDYDEPKTPAQQAESPLLSRHHSLLLTNLRPSTDTLDDANINPTVETNYDAETVVYTVTITLTDARNNSVVTTPFTFETDVFIVPAEVELGLLTENGALLDPVERKNMRTHVVQAICLGGGDCDNVSFQDGKWRADVDLTIAYKRGSWQIPSGGTSHERVRVANRVVFGRVMIERANGTVETASGAGLTVLPVSDALGETTILVDNVKFRRGGLHVSVAGVPPPAGKYLAARRWTDSNGQVSIEFDVNPISTIGPAKNLVTGERILFNVEGVLELDMSLQDATHPIDTTTVTGEITYWTRWRGSFNQWSFPETMEARASVRSAPL